MPYLLILVNNILKNTSDFSKFLYLLHSRNKIEAPPNILQDSNRKYLCSRENRFSETKINSKIKSFISLL